MLRRNVSRAVRPIVVLGAELLMVAGLFSVIPANAATFEIMPYVGYGLFDNELRANDDLHYGGTIGIFFNHIGIRGNYGITSGDPSTYNPLLEDNEMKLSNYNGDLVVRFTGEDASVVPYVFGGIGAADVELGNFLGSSIDETPTAYDFGAGLLFRLGSVIGIGLEAKDVMFKLEDAPAPVAGIEDKMTNNIIIAGGLNFAFGGGKDTDKDGVKDKKDQCPDTPIGAVVDEVGCPIDSDKDGVPDGLDQCPDTPAGATVDERGCPRDSDGDKVFDGLDRCPDTPAGVAVDASGCPLDADRDGVPDHLDQCPDTPAGTPVDERGCPRDSDGDGVHDGIDLCPNTATGSRVDKDGCPIVVSEKEVELLDKGLITVRNIKFETGKSEILSASEPMLHELGKIFIQWPQLQLEIGGHTDSKGSEALNQRLSEERANSVKNWLMTNYPQISPTMLTTKGYGEGSPIGSNANETGRALNRRVEFKVLNTEELKKIQERRRTLQSQP
jgi:outer membrane protein OmpA-like peptidoglycan-associated protein